MSDPQSIQQHRPRRALLVAVGAVAVFGLPLVTVTHFRRRKPQPALPSERRVLEVLRAFVPPRLGGRCECREGFTHDPATQPCSTVADPDPATHDRTTSCCGSDFHHPARETCCAERCNECWEGCPRCNGDGDEIFFSHPNRSLAYTIRAWAGCHGWSMIAVPTDDPPLRRAFFIDESRTIRFAWSPDVPTNGSLILERVEQR